MSGGIRPFALASKIVIAGHIAVHPADRQLKPPESYLYIQDGYAAAEKMHIGASDSPRLNANPVSSIDLSLWRACSGSWPIASSAFVAIVTRGPQCRSNVCKLQPNLMCETMF